MHPQFASSDACELELADLQRKGGANGAFADGHVKWIGSLHSVRWVPEIRDCHVSLHGREWKNVAFLSRVSRPYDRGMSKGTHRMHETNAEPPGQRSTTDSADYPRTSGMAIASLVLGIVGIFSAGLAAIPGLVLGTVALVQIRASHGRLVGKGLAIAGVSLSALAIVAFAAGFAVVTRILRSAFEGSVRQPMHDLLKDM